MSSSTSTSLTLRALLKTAVGRLGLGTPGRSVSGLTAAAKGLFAASAAVRARSLVVVPTDADVEQLTSDARFFLSALEGVSDTEAAQTVLPFPSHEVDPYRGLSPHFDIASARARALHGLSAGTARLVVASAAALLPRLSPPARLNEASRVLRPDDEISPTHLADTLAEAGYTRQDPTDEPGEFSARGGVVDFYPAGARFPIRVEFIGDNIESIRTYDPDTQRSIEPVDQIAIVPLTENVDLRPEGRSYLASSIDPAAEIKTLGSSGLQAGDQSLASSIDPAAEIKTLGSSGLQAGDQSLASSIDPAAEIETLGSSGLQAGDRSLASSIDPAAEIKTLGSSGLQAGGVRLQAGDPKAQRASTILDYVTDLRGSVFVSEPDEVRAAFVKLREQIEHSYAEKVRKNERAPEPASLVIAWEDVAPLFEQATALETLALGTEDQVRHVATQPAMEFAGRVPDWVGQLREARTAGETAVFVAHSAGRAERVIEVLADYQVPAAPIDRGEDAHASAVLVAVGRLSKGFRLPGAGLQLWAETDVFDEERVTHERRRSAAKTFLSDFRDLKAGDLVVHVDNGIGVFVGLKKIDVGLEPQEFMELHYAGEDKLFVPVERLDLVQKYSGAARPALDKLGGTTWEKAKTRVKKAMRDMAEELLKLYASRKAIPGHAFSADTHWQQEFEDAFEWELTIDQQNAVNDIKRDMESATPMDRLLCGDVGYGKTEVAMRAAFKAVMDGKQVAVLAPTTVLAFQHLKTLNDRFAAFPVRTDMVSRFRSKAEQKATLEDLAAGKVEIIVGTHRLLSKDVQFRDLGLLVVDEEQRFGVAHKEKIKQLRKRVDVLTMTATPIPRTLNMSLAGIRDMSIIETPPKDRLSIQTNVVKFDQEVMRRAIGNEMERGGQVYFVHNRVESIYSMGDLLRRLVPQAKIAVGHGQMSEDELEKVMVDFMAHKYDVLLATTIIENGLDISNANTIIVNRADRYGLSQLYQLRGRVGRSDRRAYAYLLIPPEDNLSPVAKKRLAAIREFSDLGSGFRVAALDLEIRGAGNLLGGEQSGQIEAVGFDMYMKLLEQTIKELKGEEIEDEVRANVNLRVDLRIDETYIPDMNQRLTVYRRMAGVRSEDELRRVIDESRDRYGPPPASIENLAEYAYIRLLADRIGIETIDREGHLVVLKFRPEAKLDPAWLFTIVQRRKDVQLTPPATLKLDMRIAESGRGLTGPAKSPQRSWWTARATAGEVTAGFTKDQILRPAKEDPRAEGGVFNRVSGLLRDLLKY